MAYWLPELGGLHWLCVAGGKAVRCSWRIRVYTHGSNFALLEKEEVRKETAAPGSVRDRDTF